MICEHVSALARALDGPCIVSGDWNMTPDVLAKSGFLGMINGTIFSPELETCNGNVYDCFVVTNNCVHAVAGVQRVDGVGMSPHYPARLLLRGDARRHQIRALIRPKRVAPTLMHGPQPKPPSYDSVLAELALVPLRLDNTVPDIATTKRIGTAMIDWLKLVRLEANTL